MSIDARTRLSTLTDDQKRQLAQRVSQRRPSGAAAIARRPAGLTSLPLSYAQQRFWFLTQLGGVSTAYNVAEYHRLTGALNLAALERSVNEIVRRHSSLRTTFVVNDGIPVQQIAPALYVALPIEDLSAVPPDQREQRLRSALEHEVRKPWSLETGPLFRACLWRLDDTTHQLLVIMHHIVSDGWSQGVLVRELAALYDAYSQGRPSPLPELPIEYADYAVWQHEWMRSPEFSRQLGYWKTALQDPPVLQLPQSHRAVNSVQGIHGWFFLSPELTRRVREFCQGEGATLYMVMLAAFAALLSRYSGQADIVIGSPIANRDRAEVEGLIGSFMNPLPVRVDVTGDPSFRELVRRARQSALGAFANQNVPFDVLVRSLHARRDAGAAPLFQAMFLLQNVGLQSLRLSNGNLSAKAYASTEAVAPPADWEHPGDLMYPLALQLYEFGAVIGGCVEYAGEYAPFMRQFPGHLRTLLAEAVASPQTQASALPVLTAEERAQLSQWNHESRPAPAIPVYRLFEQEALAHPERIAVVADGVSLDYRALNARANVIARALMARGVGPEVRVGLLLDRSVDMVASLLAVLKAGGAYVPLDAAYPPARLQHIAGTAALRALVTTRALPQRVIESVAGEDAAFDIINLDDLPPQDDAGNADGGASPDNLAYVIFTSGSTGLPKGTMVTHASVANAYQQWEHTYQLRDLRVHLQMASLSFDVCTGDICRALCSGATLVIAPQEVLFAPSALYGLMQQHQVEAAEFVPVVLRDLMAHVEATGASLSFMKLLVAGSDSWFTHEYERLRRLAGPGCRVVNSYGLTEATIDSTYFDGATADATSRNDDGLVPLGRAFANTEVLVLDRHLQPAPIGIAGELCVAGIALARGYLARPDMTAERFVPHPFSRTPGARLYRTGDLARYRADGTLELLGRIDNQVKLRGFRIELPEIEAVLRTHPAVLEASAIVREDRPGDRRLVAYVVLDDASVTATELRRLLRDTLPEYMVPSALVPLAAFPLTPNGKIDRAALPAPDGARQIDETFVSPRTAIERRLAEIWCGVLNLDQIGVADNFFDLGGHSLLLIQLHARLVAAVNLDLTVLDLFRFPTIGALAAHISDVSSTAVPMAPAKSRADRRRAVNRLRQQTAVRSVPNTA